MKHVIDGERNLTSDHIQRLSSGLKFSADQAHYFKNLVLLNQAKTVEDRQPFIEQILQSKSYRSLRPLSAAQYAFFSQWFFVPFRELVGLPGFKENFDWIIERFNYPVSKEQVQFAITEMLKLGLLTRDTDGRLQQSDAHVVTDDTIVSSSLAKSHQELIRRGAESIDKIPRHEREILGVTFAISQSSLAKVKERVAAFRKEMVELLSAEENPDSVYQFHLLLHPLVQMRPLNRRSK